MKPKKLSSAEIQKERDAIHDELLLIRLRFYENRADQKALQEYEKQLFMQLHQLAKIAKTKKKAGK